MGFLSEKIGKWYLSHHRDLPWRKTRDPYRIWLSEIILQQTRIDQGLPYYEAFVRRFPSVQSLAAASEREVLRLWQGLGYYTRARNMLKCARIVVRVHGARFPQTTAGLRTLPGIGAYTAAAVSSMAFNERVAVVDGNVQRLLSRYYGVATPMDTARGRDQFFHLAQTDLANNAPGTHNQAMMEFGALYCTPRNPACGLCVLRARCVAARKGWQQRLPVKKKKAAVKKRYMYYLVVRNGKRIYMKRRTESDIWKGLFDFPVIERSRPLSAASLVVQLAREGITAKPSYISSTYEHTLTHQHIHSRFVVYDKLTVTDRRWRAYTFSHVDKLPKPALISRFLADHQLF